MTTLTTALGLLPLFFGRGAELRAPLALTVIGGLSVATLLTLFVIPVVYSLVDRKTWAVEEAEAPAPAPGAAADGAESESLAGHALGEAG